jgi:hypothetical protein
VKISIETEIHSLRILSAKISSSEPFNLNREAGSKSKAEVKIRTRLVLYEKKTVNQTDMINYFIPKIPFIAVTEHKLLDKNGWLTANGINGVLNLTTYDLSKQIL